MMGQAMYIQCIAEPNGIVGKYSIDRYVTESRRLLEVLDIRLTGRSYLFGDEYTIADMATYSWARSYYWAKVNVDGLKDLQRWFNNIDHRPLTQRALTISKPFPAYFGKGDIEDMIATNAASFRQV